MKSLSELAAQFWYLPAETLQEIVEVEDAGGFTLHFTESVFVLETDFEEGDLDKWRWN